MGSTRIADSDLFFSLQTLVAEEELEKHLADGWQFVSVLPSKRILIKKANWPNNFDTKTVREACKDALEKGIPVFFQEV